MKEGKREARYLLGLLQCPSHFDRAGDWKGEIRKEEMEEEKSERWCEIYKSRRLLVQTRNLPLMT